jgi:hypothetical protein
MPTEHVADLSTNKSCARADPWLSHSKIIDGVNAGRLTNEGLVVRIFKLHILAEQFDFFSNARHTKALRQHRDPQHFSKQKLWGPLAAETEAHRRDFDCLPRAAVATPKALCSKAQGWRVPAPTLGNSPRNATATPKELRIVRGTICRIPTAAPFPKSSRHPGRNAVGVESYPVIRTQGSHGYVATLGFATKRLGRTMRCALR